jgi:hypothetical protein
MLYSDRANFTFYLFSTTIPHDIGISSFDVEIIDGDNRTMHTNSGLGYPLSDGIILRRELSCHQIDVSGSGLLNFTVTAAAVVGLPSVPCGHLVARDGMFDYPAGSR